MKTQILIAGFSLCFLMAAHATGGSKNKKTAAAKKAVPSKTRSVKPAATTVSTAPEDLFENTVVSEPTVRLNPKAVSFVSDYADKNTKDLMKLKSRGISHLQLIDGILEQHGLPVQLKYLAVIESELNSNARSHVGAVGPWQFMPATARVVGLKVTQHKDERKDFYKSTHAAAIYLKDLYNIFGDWLLVIAAYNGGPGPVYSAIKKSGSRNFWKLQQYLPAESRMHVKKFIATHYIFEGQGGVTTLTKAEVASQLGPMSGTLIRRLTTAELKQSMNITISGKYKAAVIARYVEMELSDFNRYNPELDKVLMVSLKGEYDLKLPADKVKLFLENKFQILNETADEMLKSVSETASVTPRSSDTARK